MSLIYITPHYAIIIRQSQFDKTWHCVNNKWRVILRYQALDWFWYEQKGKAKIGIIQFKYQSRFQQSTLTSVHAQAFVVMALTNPSSNCCSNSLATHVWPTKRSVQPASSSSNRLPWLTLPCAIPTSHNRNVRSCRGVGFESMTAGFRPGKLYAVNMEPFGTPGAVLLRVEWRTVHLLACAR